MDRTTGAEERYMSLAGVDLALRKKLADAKRR